MVNLKSLTPHKRVSLGAIVLSLWLILNNTIWYIIGNSQIVFETSILLFGMFLVPLILIYLFENTITQYLLVICIWSISIVSGFLFPNNEYSFMFQLISVGLMLSYNMHKKIIWFLIFVKIVFSLIVMYFYYNSIQPVINTFGMMIIITMLFFLAHRDFRIEIKKRDELIKDTKDAIDNIIKKVEDGQ